MKTFDLWQRQEVDTAQALTTYLEFFTPGDEYDFAYSDVLAKELGL